MSRIRRCAPLVALFAATVLAAATINGGLVIRGLTTTYNNVATAGWGQPAIYAARRLTGQTAEIPSLSTYTVGAADGSFLVSANVFVEDTSTVFDFNAILSYTAEDNQLRSVFLTFTQFDGTFTPGVTADLGVGPYMGTDIHIRAKAGTAINIKTFGTFTAVTYSAEGYITQIG